MGISLLVSFKTRFCKESFQSVSFLNQHKLAPVEVEEVPLRRIETFSAWPTCHAQKKSGQTHTHDMNLYAGNNPRKGEQMAPGYSPAITFSPKNRPLPIAQLEQLISSSIAASVPHQNSSQ
ncbi:hypothetical protein Csa_010395 [Cucumis sativus]|nr:hypothetical protein Csa_010395 [Cucumis sativus]